MVTTSPVAPKAAPAGATSPARANLTAGTADALAGAAKPGVPANDPFGMLMGQMDASAAGPTVPVAITAGTPVALAASTPVAMPSVPAPPVQAPTPGQLPMPSVPGQATAPSSGAAKSSGDSAAETARDKAPDDRPDATLVTAEVPPPPPIMLPQPIGTTPASPAPTGDAARGSPAAPAGDAVATAPAVDGASASANGTGAPTALIAAQAALSLTARPTSRTTGTDAGGAAPALPEDDEEKHGPTSDQPGPLPPVGSAAMAPTSTSPAANLPAPTPASGDNAVRSASLQPRAATPGQPARAAKTALEPTGAASPPAPVPTLPAPAPDVMATNTPPLAAIASPASVGTGPTSASPAAASPKSDAQAQPASPASQVARAIVEPVKVMMSGPAQVATAPHVTTIQITPVELGRVDIRIERTEDGPAKIQLVAERPETLSRLVHDQSQLHQALDQAGIPQAGRMLDFSLAPTPPADAGAGSSFAGTAMGGDSSSGHERRGSETYVNRALGTANEVASAATPFLRSVRAGIDITA